MIPSASGFLKHDFEVKEQPSGFTKWIYRALL